MLKLVVRRVLAAIPMIIILSLLVFVLLDLIPGDAAASIAGESASTEQIEATRERLGLDDPLVVRYVDWLGGVLHGDLGTSLYSSSSVTSLLWDRIPVTASLAVVSFVIVLCCGLPLGVAAAWRPGSVADRLVSGASALLMSVPPFVVGLLMVLLFAVQFGVFPATGYVHLGDAGFGEWLRHLILPGLAVAAIPTAEVARQTRSALVEVMSQDFIRAVRAKGMRWPNVVGKHALKNAGVPIATVVGLVATRMFSGVVTVEFVFAIPGLGSLALNAVVQRDVPLIQGIVFVSALLVVVVNLVVDLAYGYLNPKMRS